MRKFALELIKEIEGKLKLYKLMVNGKCEFNEFLEQCKAEGNYQSELKQIQSRLQQIADLKVLPQEKHRDITPKKESVKEYEIKTKHLRIYMFYDKELGRIIISGGKKTTQKKDISHFRNLKTEYLKSK